MRYQLDKLVINHCNSGMQLHFLGFFEGFLQCFLFYLFSTPFPCARGTAFRPHRSTEVLPFYSGNAIKVFALWKRSGWHFLMSLRGFLIFWAGWVQILRNFRGIFQLECRVHCPTLWPFQLGVRQNEVFSFLIVWNWCNYKIIHNLLLFWV